MIKTNQTHIIPEEMREAVKAIKQAILRSQYRAAKGVNAEQLSLYFGIGRYISEHSRNGYWGTGAIESISEQLQKELPGLRGFGVSSMKNMRLFFEEWKQLLFRQPAAGDLTSTAIRQPAAGELESSIDVTTLMPALNWQLSAAEIEAEEFLGISFTHHIEILSKSKDVTESAPFG